MNHSEEATHSFLHPEFRSQMISIFKTTKATLLVMECMETCTERESKSPWAELLAVKISESDMTEK